ncbi:hypothetical protein WA171_003096 [Blastocystis sp. BT1]
MDEKNGSSPVYKSEVAKNGGWKPFEIDVGIFCNGDLNRPLSIKIYQYKSNGNHVEIGVVSSSTQKLIEANKASLSLSNGAISIPHFEYVSQPSFLNYIQAGLDINFMVAIDFTGSNGNPNDPTSLHYNNPSLYMQGRLNPYEMAISAIGSVLEFYDTDRMFPTYGFGACLNGMPTANHCFALNGNEMNPEVPGVSGIMGVYHHTLSTVRFSGPTLFEGVLSKAVGIAEQIKQEKNKYLILLIITDGVIHDMDETIRMIVRGADAPLSILIVGVGNEDFGNMEILDGDDERLSYNGKIASRDIVQFVPTREMINRSLEEMAKSLLEEIPGQVTDYMHTEGITPEMIAQMRPLQVTPM